MTSGNGEKGDEKLKEEVEKQASNCQSLKMERKERAR